MKRTTIDVRSSIVILVVLSSFIDLPELLICMPLIEKEGASKAAYGNSGVRYRA